MRRCIFSKRSICSRCQWQAWYFAEVMIVWVQPLPFFVASEEDISVQLAAVVQLMSLQYEGLYMQDAQQINDAKILNVQMWKINTHYTSRERICNRYTGNWVNTKVLNRVLQRLWVHLLQSRDRDNKFPFLVEELKLHHSWCNHIFYDRWDSSRIFYRWYPMVPK